MSTRSIFALFLTLIMCLACFAGCAPNAPVPDVTPESETLDPNHTEEPITEIPDEDLSGMNTSDDPLEDDGNGAAILTRLLDGKLLKNT